MKRFLAPILIFTIFTLGHSVNAEQVTDGYGTETLPDGSVYEGEFKGGLFNGKGKLTWENGSVYEGEFKDGRRQGKGERVFGFW